jgi:ABC-2 type transport system permease protein
LSEALRSFRMAAWLGWQIESNWTDPFLFAIYSIVKPVAGAAILVVMFGIITGGQFDSPIFSYIFLGNAFYIYVGQIMTGISWAVIEDREHYRTMKYLYIAPIRIPYYLVGRGAARFITGSVSVVITLLAGLLFLNLRLDPAAVDWPAFLAALLIGVVMLALLGLLLAGITMLTAHNVYFIGDSVAGALYLFSGAIFPLEVLPEWLRPVGYVMPLSYWLELLRRTMLGTVAEAFPTFAQFTNVQLFGILGGLTVGFGVLSILAFRWCDYLARERGMIDRVTNW